MTIKLLLGANTLSTPSLSPRPSPHLSHPLGSDWDDHPAAGRQRIEQLRWERLGGSANVNGGERRLTLQGI